MAEVRFDDLAAANLGRLYDDPTKAQLADRVDVWLVRLEAGDEATTRDEYRSPALGLVYVILVYGSGEQVGDRLEAPLGRAELRALPRPGRVALTNTRERGLRRAGPCRRALLGGAGPALGGRRAHR